MVVLTSHAEQATTDNLLNNNTFDENTDGWTLSDSNVKRDANSYNDAGNSPTIRFKGQTSTITQSVDTSGLETNKEITDVTVKYHGYGCGNTPNGWCTAGGDDTIVTNVTLKNEAGTEVSSHAITVPYEDGWTHHTFTKSINNTFLTGETGITFSLQGIDTGDSSGWLGPITDNYELLVTYQNYVAPVIEPVIVEPVIVEPVIVEPIVIEPIVIEPIVVVEPEIIEPIVIEPIVVIEETVIEGLSLETEVINDIILDPVAIDIPEIPQISMDIELPELPEISMSIELPVDMPEIEVVEEIQEIPVNDPIEEIAEVDVESEIDEQPEELKEPNVEQDLADAEEKINEPDNNQKENTSKKKKDSNTKKTTTEKSKEKPQSKTVAKVNKPVVKSKEPSISADPLGEISIASMVYLQMIPETITIQETVSLTQEMIYEQDIGAFTSSATYDSLISSANSRWLRMVDVRPKHTFGGYGR